MTDTYATCYRKACRRPAEVMTFNGRACHGCHKKYLAAVTASASK